MTQTVHRPAKSHIAKIAVLGVSALAMTASFSVAARADDACHKIATAKYLQWRQPRIERQMTSEYADGKAKMQSAVFTPGTLYVLQGAAWIVGPLTTAQHRVSSPEQVMGNIGLTDCEAVENVDLNGEHATAYTYKSDAGDVDTSGKIWVSDATGLPLRDEMSPDQATPQWPVKMSANYTYGAEVVVPKGAELADDFRRMDARSVLSDFMTESEKSFK